MLCFDVVEKIDNINCTGQSLPLWGRCQPKGLTEEVQDTLFIHTRYGEMEK